LSVESLKLDFCIFTVRWYQDYTSDGTMLIVTGDVEYIFQNLGFWRMEEPV